MPLENVWRDAALGVKKSVVGDLRESVSDWRTAALSPTPLRRDGPPACRQRAMQRRRLRLLHYAVLPIVKNVDVAEACVRVNDAPGAACYSSSLSNG
jgi:hypothetical protein